MVLSDAPDFFGGLNRRAGAEDYKRKNDPGGSRTRDLRIKSPLLYQLSYRVGLRNVFGESRKSHYVVLCDSN